MTGLAITCDIENDINHNTSEIKHSIEFKKYHVEKVLECKKLFIEGRITSIDDYRDKLKEADDILIFLKEKGPEEQKKLMQKLLDEYRKYSLMGRGAFGGTIGYWLLLMIGAAVVSVKNENKLLKEEKNSLIIDEEKLDSNFSK